MKERVKTVAIASLLIVTIILCQQIWLAPPTGKKRIKTVDPTLTESVKGRIFPFSAIINFGDGKHTKMYQLKNLWPFYRNLLKQNFSVKEEIRWERVSGQKYLELQEEPSVVFVLKNESHSKLFKDIYAIDNLEGRILRLYFSEVEGILLETDQGVYRSDAWTTLSDINQYIQSIDRRSVEPYSSLWERYRIPRGVYLPDQTPTFDAGIVYRNELKDLQGKYRNNLVQRILDASIDQIHVIKEDDSVLYVYGKSNLRLSEDGLLDYKNGSEIPRVKTSRTGAIQLTYEFLTKAMGSVENVYLEHIDPIKDGNREGHRVVLNYVEKGLSVVPVREKPGDYIVVDVFDNRVERARYLYRSNMGARTSSDIKALSFEALMAKNPDIFGETDRDRERILRHIMSFSKCYIDDAIKPEFALRPGYSVQIDEKSYLFDAQTGEVIGGGGA